MDDVRRRQAGALAPRLQRDEKKGVVRRVDEAQQTEADDRVVALHAGRVFEDCFDTFRSRIGSLQRCGNGKLHVDEEVSLIFFR
jgi:hypothetical protein